MRRPGLQRVFAATMLLWFACVTGAPEAWHSCPVHDVAVASPAHGGHAAHAHQPARGDTDRNTCTCIGDCCAAGATPSLPAERTALVVVASQSLQAAFPQPVSPALAAPAFLHPYANGPPGAPRDS
jgi:hypothetical protein